MLINCNAQVSGPTLLNPFTGFEKSTLIDYYCDAIDIESALSMRQSIILIDIGRLLGELAVRFRIHNHDALILDPIARDIELMKAADAQRGHNIEFEYLEMFRSKHMPSKGPSIAELHSYTAADVDQLAKGNKNKIYAARHFMRDPASLQEQRLSQLYTF